MEIVTNATFCTELLLILGLLEFWRTEPINSLYQSWGVEDCRPMELIYDS